MKDDQAPVMWRKSTYSNDEGACVQLARSPKGGVMVRDSKNRRAGMVIFTADEWAAFTAGVKAGEFG